MFQFYSILHFKSESELFVKVGHLTLHGHMGCDVFDKFSTQNHDICLPFLTEENLRILHLFCFQFNGAIFTLLVSFQDDIYFSQWHSCIIHFPTKLEPSMSKCADKQILNSKAMHAKDLAIVKTEGARLVRWWWWWWTSRNMKLWVSHPGAKVNTAWPRTGHWMATSLH